MSLDSKIIVERARAVAAANKADEAKDEINSRIVEAEQARDEAVAAKNLAVPAKDEAIEAKDDAEIAKDIARSAAVDALMSAGVQPEHISYTKGVKPSKVGVPESTIGAYYTFSDTFQKLIFENGNWAEIGETLPSISYVNRKLSDEEDNRTNAISGAINQEVIDRDGAIGSAINQEVIDRNLKITQEVQSEAIARSQEISDEKIYLEGKIDTNTSNITAAALGIKPFQTKALMDGFTPGDGGDDRELAKVYDDGAATNNGTYNWSGSAWVKDSALTDVATIKSWVSAGSFDISNMTFSTNGNIATADLVWPDGELGTINSLLENSDGYLTRLRFHRPGAKYIEVALTYSGDSVLTQTLTEVGY